MTVLTCRVARTDVTENLLRTGLTQFVEHSPEVLRFYDLGAAGPETMSVRMLGRLGFLHPGVAPRDAAALLDVDADDLWSRIPLEADLGEADPGTDSALYDDAEELYRRYLAATPRLGSGTLSAAVHLCRPRLFVILSPALREIYEHDAAEEWQRSSKPVKPYSRRTYWPVIRRDIIANRSAIADWRTELGQSTDELTRSVAQLSDLRLWGIAVTVLAQRLAR